MFFFSVNFSIASPEKSGATRHSMNSFDINSAVSPSTGRFTAITEPNALTGSVAKARLYASASESPTPSPHGVVCLMIATAGRGDLAKGDRLSNAPSKSRILLYERSFP